MIDPARSSWRCLKGHTDGPKASWSRVCVSCLYLALRPCIVRRVSRARGRGVPWTDGEEELKTWGGAGRRAGAGGGARGFHVCECAEPRYLIYNSSAQPRLTRAVQQTPLARPSTAISFHRAPAGSGRPRGAGRVASERAHTNVRRPQNVQREEGGPHMCVCGARVDSLRSRTDHTPQPTLSRLAVALGQ